MMPSGAVDQGRLCAHFACEESAGFTGEDNPQRSGRRLPAETALLLAPDQPGNQGHDTDEDEEEEDPLRDG